ncbi:hypothetical protein BCU70_11180 [Vibrio sp. 10N.286.49.C2]|uniref:hypothetical protein n=1 Tax=unclassified Vibrio TaxID=2614977 RepID=UPI000C84BBA9|nr:MULTISPECIES: hypothetical protein [unclassified Vibrio]PMH40714.1 hypothetical protein BCU70_11180 [Vibrio sp. 10N.286.49.C2]PMH45245.1 hypothetical protein BCU66_02780 [Vibrio sp. 10N.286.49.B1]PMH78251.1 hypothetical protein BCU58_09840 [Vibrio sp. 10N.286.48.B7]
MSYFYVFNIYDESYITVPPAFKRLNSNDVPEEEIEIRDIITCWYEAGLQPLERAIPVNCSFLENKKNFERLTRMLKTLIRYKAYFCAMKRIISQWHRESLARRYLDYLLEKHVSTEYKP